MPTKFYFVESCMPSASSTSPKQLRKNRKTRRQRGGAHNVDCLNVVHTRIPRLILVEWHTSQFKLVVESLAKALKCPRLLSVHFAWVINVITHGLRLVSSY